MLRSLAMINQSHISIPYYVSKMMIENKPFNFDIFEKLFCEKHQKNNFKQKLRHRVVEAEAI